MRTQRPNYCLLSVSWKDSVADHHNVEVLFHSYLAGYDTKS